MASIPDPTRFHGGPCDGAVVPAGLFPSPLISVPHGNPEGAESFSPKVRPISFHVAVYELKTLTLGYRPNGSALEFGYYVWKP